MTTYIPSQSPFEYSEPVEEAVDEVEVDIEVEGAKIEGSRLKRPRLRSWSSGKVKSRRGVNSQPWEDRALAKEVTGSI